MHENLASREREVGEHVSRFNSFLLLSFRVLTFIFVNFFIFFLFSLGKALVHSQCKQRASHVFSLYCTLKVLSSSSRFKSGAGAQSLELTQGRWSVVNFEPFPGIHRPVVVWVTHTPYSRLVAAHAQPPLVPSPFSQSGTAVECNLRVLTLPDQSSRMEL